MIVALWTLIAVSAAWVAFAYAGYPLALMLMARLSPRPVIRADISPPLSIIIAVYNGEKVLRQKLEATLALEYAGTLEIIVASDGSTDGTDTIAESFAERRVPGRASVGPHQRRGIILPGGDVRGVGQVHEGGPRDRPRHSH